MTDPDRRLHVVHLLIRDEQDGEVRFLVFPHPKWVNDQMEQYLAMPTKKTVAENNEVTDPLEPFEPEGVSIDEFVDAICQEDLGLAPDDYAMEAELEPARVPMISPSKGIPTLYTVYPIDVWVHPDKRRYLEETLRAKWVTWVDALAEPLLSPTARGVFGRLKEALESPDDARPASWPGSWQQLVAGVSDRPSMDALAMKWFSRHKTGVRVLPADTLTEILDVGSRAFNLRVADPYLRYQMQGIGFTWSFFTHKDKQDLHVHGAPVVEIYGVVEGEIAIWWKHYCDRGTPAWNHDVVGPGGWIEVDSLYCHLVAWRAEGKGVVFKAGPEHLAGVGRIGVEGKTGCAKCPYPCMKPERLRELQELLAQGGRVCPDA